MYCNKNCACKGFRLKKKSVTAPEPSVTAPEPVLPIYKEEVPVSNNSVTEPVFDPATIKSIGDLPTSKDDLLKIVKELGIVDQVRTILISNKLTGNPGLRQAVYIVLKKSLSIHVNQLP
jgi:hypothetical protein